jgi:hypothetical protein
VREGVVKYVDAEVDEGAADTADSELDTEVKDSARREPKEFL